MLTALDIRDVVLIEALQLDFAAGLGVLTGETGAGKSILLDSLGLALGARGDAALVRAGAPFATVTASFHVSPDHPARAVLAENDLGNEDLLILRRRISADGVGRAFINDQPVSVALLREVGGRLVEVHGQADERGLLNARGHRDLLDSFGGLGGDVARVATAYAAWQTAESTLAAAGSALEASQRDREWLDHAVAELATLDAQVGEEDSLAAARTEMQKGARLAGDLAAVTSQLLGSDGGLAALRQAARRLDRVAADHPLLAQALASLDRAVIEASEAEDMLAAAARALTFAPEALDAAEARLFELRAAARKHRVEPEALPRLAADLLARSQAIALGVDGLAELSKAARDAQTNYVGTAKLLTAARAAAARRLDAAVTAELAPLKLDAARFRTVLAEAPGGAGGADAVSFEIATNRGAQFGPLNKIASGGELSRFILALKVALAATGSAGTIVFDEIDRGVGGAVASAIGDRLARLAATAQVLVVTHSPQVAARGAHQWLITKSTRDAITRTDVVQLDVIARQEEIARMLSGAEITTEARAQAGRLLSAI